MDIVENNKKVSTIVDTDAGYDPDDIFALLLLLKSPELNPDLIITGDEVTGKRASFTVNFLDMVGRKEIPVATGIDNGNDDFVMNDYATKKPRDVNIDFAVKNLIDNSDQVNYINIQGCSNLAKILEKFHTKKDKFKIYQMGGSIDYMRREGWKEHNLNIDVVSAFRVLQAEADITFVGAHTTFNEKYKVDNNHHIYQKLKKSKCQAYNMLAEHIDNFNQKTGYFPFMHDPLTVSVALGKDFVEFEKTKVNISDSNIVRSNNGYEVLMSKPESKEDEFMDFLESRLF